MLTIITATLVSLLSFFTQTGNTNTATLVIVIKGTDTRGKVIGCLYKGKDGWPEQYTKSYKQFSQAGVDGSTTVTIKGIAYGEYAVLAMQDEDGNGRLTKTSIGIPKEKYGASRDARNAMRGPDYEAAAFTINQAETQITFTIKHSALL